MNSVKFSVIMLLIHAAFTVKLHAMAQVESHSQQQQHEADPKINMHDNYIQQIQKPSCNVNDTQQVTSFVSQTNTAAAATQNTKKLAEKSLVKDSSKLVSWGMWFDGIYEKVNKNIWGHAQGVIDAIRSKRFIAHNTDHVNSLNRAIDECIEGGKQQLFLELMELCMENDIQINSSHIEKADEYLKIIRKRLVAISASFCTMKKRIAENLQNAEVHKDDLEIDGIAFE